MSAILLEPLRYQFETPRDLDRFLDKPQRKATAQDALNLLVEFGQKRWNLAKEEIEASLQALGKLAPYFARPKAVEVFCKSNETKTLESLSQEFNEVLKIHRYVQEHKRDWIRQDAILLFMHKTSLDRPIQINPEGEVIVHLTRAKKGDKVIGAGTFKRVKMAARLGDSKQYASASSAPLNRMEQLALELFRGHPGFVQLITYFEYIKNKKWKGRALFEYCNSGHLWGREVNPTDRKRIFEELIQNVAYMHSKGIIHRDLKCANILLHENERGLLQPVISDFGSCCYETDREKREEYATTWIYISPKAAKAVIKGNDEHLSEASDQRLDTWSLGCVLFKLLKMGRFPWEDILYEDEGLKKISECKGAWFYEPQLPDSPEHLVWEMLQGQILVRDAVAKLENLNWQVKR